MLDQIIHFVGLCLFAGTWLLVGGWMMWASLHAVLRFLPVRRATEPANRRATVVHAPARVRLVGRSGSLASLAA